MSDGHECPTCGDGFDTLRGMKIHHSRKHGIELGDEMQTTTCRECGDRFEHRSCVDRKYCGTKCRDKSMKKRTELACDHCQTTYKTHPSEVGENNFCSKECRDKWLQTITGEDHWHFKGRVTRPCSYCGEDITRRPSAFYATRAFCSDRCGAEWRSEELVGEDAPAWRGGTFPYGPGWNYSKKEAVRDRDGRECQLCGRSEEEHLKEFGSKHAVHHIQKARSFDDPEKRNAMSNLITLCCGDCHSTFEQMAPLRPDVATAGD